MTQARYNFDGAAHDISIKKSVSLVEEGAIVDLVVSAVFDEDSYFPNFYSYALYANILKFYTDYDIGGETDIDSIYRLINESDLVEVVLFHISPVQMASIRSAINGKIRYYQELQIAAVAPDTQANGLAADLRVLIAKWDKKFEKAFKPRVVDKALRNIAEMDVDSQTLPEAVVTAYSANQQ